MSEQIAIYPGSFDPLTEGHLSIIERAARLFDRLIVVIGYNPRKETFFGIEERLQFIRESTRSLANVEVDSFSNELLVHYAARVDATVVVRGLRNQDDFRNELQQSKINQKLLPQLEYVFLLSDADEIFVSSTLVRDTIRARGRYDMFVPSTVEKDEGHRKQEGNG